MSISADSPLSWTRHFSKKKNLYYWHNSETNESIWDIEDKNDPRFWIKLKSKKQNKDYWFNIVTKKSEWKNSIKNEENPTVETNETTEISEKIQTTKIEQPISHKKACMNRLIQRTKNKKKEAQSKFLEKSEHNKSSNVEDILDKIEKISLKDEKKSEKLEIKKEKSPSKPTNSSYSNTHFNREPEYKEWEVCNGMGIQTTVRARDKYEAMEEMRYLRESLDPHA